MTDVTPATARSRMAVPDTALLALLGSRDESLRTAEELDSLHQLARLIGYQPGPGVAASADIAFTMDSAPGAPASVVVIGVIPML